MARTPFPEDPDTLDRFVTAQRDAFAAALSELAAGRKQSHWMWFIFPQLRGLGRSALSQHYGVADADEARRYLAHPLLGPRLLKCSAALLAHHDLPAEAIFGPIDAAKLRSSATLFAALDGAPDVFDRILATFFDARPCPLTRDQLNIPPALSPAPPPPAGCPDASPARDQPQPAHPTERPEGESSRRPNSRSRHSPLDR